MKATSARRKGLQAEVQARTYLNDHGLICEQIPAGTAIDRGDLVLVDGDGDRWTIQVKCYADTNRAITEGLAELPAQMAASGALLGAVVQRPKGKPDPAEWRVILTLSQFALVLGGTPPEPIQEVT